LQGIPEEGGTKRSTNDIQAAHASHIAVPDSGFAPPRVSLATQQPNIF